MRYLFVLGVLVCASAVSFGQQVRLGSTVPDFTVYDLKGTPAKFSTLRGDTTVVMFISAQCPVSNAYNERMNALDRDYALKGVRFVVVNSNATESVDWVKQHAAEHGFVFQVYKDRGNVVADLFGAQVTPETFVIDRAGVLRYHGAIDDSQNPANVKVQGLRMALDAVLAGQSVQKAETKAFGCSIKRAKRVS